MYEYYTFFNISVHYSNALIWYTNTKDNIDNTLLNYRYVPPYLHIAESVYPPIYLCSASVSTRYMYYIIYSVCVCNTLSKITIHVYYTCLCVSARVRGIYKCITYLRISDLKKVHRSVEGGENIVNRVYIIWHISGILGHRVPLALRPTAGVHQNMECFVINGVLWRNWFHLFTLYTHTHTNLRVYSLQI